MANENELATLAESLSEIREAIERVATAIKFKDNTVVVVNSNEPASLAEAPQEISLEKTQPTKSTASEELPSQAHEAPLVTTAQAEQEHPRPLRVESQVRVREPDGSRWIVSVRSYSDGQLREDRKPYRS